MRCFYWTLAAALHTPTALRSGDTARIGRLCARRSPIITIHGLLYLYRCIHNNIEITNVSMNANICIYIRRYTYLIQIINLFP